MSENIFTSETPSTGDDAGGGTNRVLGIVFKASVAGTIDAIRWYGPSTPPSGTASAHLFAMTNPNDVTGTLLASQNFGSITGATWNEAVIGNAISPNVPYLAQIFTPDHYCYSGGGLWTTDFTNAAGHLTVYAASTSNNGRFKNVASATDFPNNSSGSGFNFFVDVVFTPGTTVTGTASAALGQLVAAATGTPTVLGVAAANLGVLLATAVTTGVKADSSPTITASASSTATVTRR